MLLLLAALAALNLVAADVPDVSIRVVRDIPYLAASHYADKKDTLDLYLPEGVAKPPVIVWYYGGALQQGDKTDRDDVAAARRFASAGIATAVVNYRLSPGVSHPAHIEDAAASFAWVTKHIAEYGGDPARIFVVGHSAGAYLAALLVTDERYLEKHGLSLRDITGAVPVSAFFWVEREGVAPDRPKTVWGTDSATWVDASPAHHLRGGLPPMLILYADGDEPWRRQQNVEMEQAVRKAGSAHVRIGMVADRSHMSILRHLGDDKDPASQQIIEFVKSLR